MSEEIRRFAPSSSLLAGDARGKGDRHEGGTDAGGWMVVAAVAVAVVVAAAAAAAAVMVAVV